MLLLLLLLSFKLKTNLNKLFTNIFIFFLFSFCFLFCFTTFLKNIPFYYDFSTKNYFCLVSNMQSNTYSVTKVGNFMKEHLFSLGNQLMKILRLCFKFSKILKKKTDFMQLTSLSFKYFSLNRVTTCPSKIKQLQSYVIAMTAR